jgi:hypothetical protein
MLISLRPGVAPQMKVYNSPSLKPKKKATQAAEGGANKVNKQQKFLKFDWAKKMQMR